tara:strand:- start:369 stop:728 length:360 start_codon:yes stop_codon:yes gene_type:complete
VRLIADKLGIQTQCKDWNHSIDEQKIMYDGTDLGESFCVRKDAWMLGISDTFYLSDYVYLTSIGGRACHIVGDSPFTNGQSVYLHFVSPRKYKDKYNVKKIPIRREFLKRSRILLIERY